VKLGILMSLALFGANALAGDWVVVSSTAESPAVGSIYAQGADLELKAAVTVTLMSASGQRVTLTGPDRVALPEARATQKERSMIRKLAMLMTPKSDTGIAAGRGEGGEPREIEDPWVLHLEDFAGESFCFDPERPPALVRDAIDEELAVRVTDYDGGLLAEVSWSKGERARPWPDTVAVDVGEVLVVWRDGLSGAEKYLELRALPVSLPMPKLPMWMIENGCYKQAVVLAASGSSPGP
jgi:hypothetical protein